MTLPPETLLTVPIIPSKFILKPGHRLLYKVKIGKIIQDKQKQLDGLIGFFSNFKGNVKESVVEIEGDVPNELQKILSEKIKKLISGVKEVKFAKTATKK